MPACGAPPLRFGFCTVMVPLLANVIIVLPVYPPDGVAAVDSAAFHGGICTTGRPTCIGGCGGLPVRGSTKVGRHCHQLVVKRESLAASRTGSALLETSTTSLRRAPNVGLPHTWIESLEWNGP